MTNEQIRHMEALHSSGMSYGAIANEVGISIGTVKSFFFRKKPTATTPTEKPMKATQPICKNCGQTMTGGRYRPKVFCSDRCRMLWWKAHAMRSDSIAVCAGCGKEFDTSGRSSRKYCSHSCYIAARYHSK